MFKRIALAHARRAFTRSRVNGRLPLTSIARIVGGSDAAAQLTSYQPKRSASTKAAAASSTSSNALNSAASVHGSVSSPSVVYVGAKELSGSALKTTQSLQAIACFITHEQREAIKALANEAHVITIDAIFDAIGGSEVGGQTKSSGGSMSIFANANPISLASLQDFKADKNDTLWVYPSSSSSSSSSSYPRLLLVGLGSSKDVTLATYRSASWRAVASFQSLLLTEVGVYLPSTPPLDHEQRFFDSHYQNEMIGNVARTTILSDHYFRRYLTEEQVDKRKKRPLKKIVFIDAHAHGSHTTKPSSSSGGSSKSKKSAASSSASSLLSPLDPAETIATHVTMARATILAREWANERGDVATPSYMEAEARRIVKEAGSSLKMSVVNDTELEKEGLHLLRAVGQAAKDKARLVVIEYHGDPSSKSYTALVGKGITFDTGGLLIKGRGNMEGMHLDMSGSAAVLATMATLPSLKLKQNIVGVLALAENAISADAYKPLTILPSVAGSVEIQDTDAEGRLALVDAMTYVQKKYPVTTLIDLATLTGAAVVALGEHIAAIFSNSDALAQRVQSASTASGEKVWRMPIEEEHEQELKSTYAEFKNCATHRWVRNETFRQFT